MSQSPEDKHYDEIVEAFDARLITMKAKRIFWIRLCIVLVSLFSMTTVSVIVWAVLEIRETQLNGTPTGKAILESAETIESCTTPGRACYRRNQENLAGAINSINDYTIFAIACGVNLVQGEQKPTPNQVRKCVSDAIEEQR